MKKIALVWYYLDTLSANHNITSFNIILKRQIN